MNVYKQLNTPPLQVKSGLYRFTNYVNKDRWASFYHQIIEIVSVKADSILEVGVGSGVLSAVLKGLGFPYESLDIDPDLSPDHIGSILEIPFADKSYDIVGCFQVIEHLPYEQFQKSVHELFRVARKTVIISLPDAKTLYRYSFHIPKVGYKKLLISYPLFRAKTQPSGGDHCWEINKKGYPLVRIKKELKSIAKESGFELYKEYRVWENPWHHFFCFKVENLIEHDQAKGS
jgi:ubiquinone/menaquinone biosynthesis C-methylase UbiE